MKRLVLAAGLAATALASSGTAWAAPLSATVPVNGPFLYAGNFDSTCGPQAGQVLGSFTATTPPANPDGSYDVQFKLTTSFVTLAGPSFTACNPSTHANSGRIIREGVSGTIASTSVYHLTSATFTGTTTCPRDQNGSCDFVAYLRNAYGTGVNFTPTYAHAVLHSNAPRLIKRQAVESCSGAICATGLLKISGDIASGVGP